MLTHLLPGDAMSWQRSWSTLVKVMACCLMAPSHYLNQCWLLISEVLWLSPENNFTSCVPATIQHHAHDNYMFNIAATFPRRQWVNHIIRLPSPHGDIMNTCFWLFKLKLLQVDADWWWLMRVIDDDWLMQRLKQRGEQAMAKWYLFIKWLLR